MWGEKLPFGTVCGEFNAGGWVHAVNFSPDGNSIAYCAHDSTVTIANGPNAPLQVISTSHLPFTTLFYANDSTLIAAGYDCAPFMIKKNGDTW